MSWKIRMHLSASKGFHLSFKSGSSSIVKEKPYGLLYNETASVGYFTRRPQIVLSQRCLNEKRARSKETASDKDTGKRSKPNIEPPRLVLVCGQNICGQLGLSSTVIERHKPQLLRITDEKIQSICAGAMHSCALTSNGHVYTWGCNDDGALGRVTQEIDEEYRPDLFIVPESITTLCAGDSFTVALTQTGRAYISGCFRSSCGVLGLFEHRQVISEPIILPFDRPIKSIACGADFCLLLTENGTPMILCLSSQWWPFCESRRTVLFRQQRNRTVGPWCSSLTSRANHRRYHFNVAATESSVNLQRTACPRCVGRRSWVFCPSTDFEASSVCLWCEQFRTVGSSIETGDLFACAHRWSSPTRSDRQDRLRTSTHTNTRYVRTCLRSRQKRRWSIR